VVLMCDFARPANGNGPVLLSLIEVETLFHEMGHAMHCKFIRFDGGFSFSPPLPPFSRLTIACYYCSYDWSNPFS
jgi:hypothetical protein